MSLMIVSSDCETALIFCTLSALSGCRPSSSSMSAKPSTPVMGVRISWLMEARKSDFAFSADSALMRRPDSVLAKSANFAACSSIRCCAS